jgi:hypothetical protein
MKMFAAKKEGKKETVVAQARHSDVPFFVGDVFVTDPAVFVGKVLRN